MRRRPRGLRPEEEALWQQVARTAKPMRQISKTPLSENPPKPKPIAERADFDIRPFRVGETAAAPAVMGAKRHDQPVRMDRKTHARMKRGKSAPEARIDLHGMTAAAAQTALTAFILRAFSDEKRLVLVITGKGRHADDGDPVPRRAGVLRQSLPEWLAQPPLSSLVLDWTSAHQRHGGSGAFYVYLRRRR